MNEAKIYPPCNTTNIIILECLANYAEVASLLLVVWPPS